MPYKMSTSKRSSAVCLLLSLCLGHLVMNCAAEQTGTTDNGTETVTERVTKRVTERVGDKIPNPWQYPEQCRRQSTEGSWICDVDGVLPQEQADSIDSLLVSINANASCVCNCSSNTTLPFADDEGYAMGVAVVRTLDEDFSVANRTYHLEQFGDAVRRDWFINRSCDDSALILAHYMYNCSKIYISLGDAFNSLLPGQSLSPIYEAVQPSLDTGNIGQAITVTIHRLDAAVNQAMLPTDPPPPNNLVWGILGVITISTILVFHYWIKY